MTPVVRLEKQNITYVKERKVGNMEKLGQCSQ